jgi:hypothetical protein
MGDSFGQFLSDHPFWAIFIAVFMILPMIGAVIHIVLKALGRRGIDNSPPSSIGEKQPENGPDLENRIKDN